MGYLNDGEEVEIDEVYLEVAQFINWQQFLDESKDFVPGHTYNRDQLSWRWMHVFWFFKQNWGEKLHLLG